MQNISVLITIEVLLFWFNVPNYLHTYKYAQAVITMCSLVLRFSLLVPSCCDKSGTSCYHLVTRLMTVTDLLQVVPTRLIQAVRNKLLRACSHQLVTCRRYQTCWNNLLRVCWPHQPCYKMITTCARLVNNYRNKQCEHISLTSCEFKIDYPY
jgi:hypothetical protein